MTLDTEPDAIAYKQALLYIIARCEREYKASDYSPELDFVILAVNEVKKKLNL